MFERLSALSYRSRLLVLVVTTAAILVMINIQIANKQDILENGHTLLLQLAPRDPRSLLQGDYMALRYAMTDEVAHAAKAAKISDGRVIVEPGPDKAAGFVALYQGQALAQGQRILRFRRRGESVRLASDAYFFEEGQWQTYADARYGELRVDSHGDAVLVGLRDREGRRLGPGLH